MQEQAKNSFLLSIYPKKNVSHLGNLRKKERKKVNPIKFNQIDGENYRLTYNIMKYCYHYNVGKYVHITRNNFKLISHLELFVIMKLFSS